MQDIKNLVKFLYNVFLGIWELSEIIVRLHNSFGLIVNSES